MVLAGLREDSTRKWYNVYSKGVGRDAEHLSEAGHALRSFLVEFSFGFAETM